MEIKELTLKKIKPSPYNPRLDLEPGDPGYEKIKRSIEQFNLVEPLVWNKRSGNLVGGHQRYKIIKDRGDKRVQVVVVDLDDNEERTLNLALNKAVGDWDTVRLAELLKEMQDVVIDDDAIPLVELGGFDQEEFDTIIADAEEIIDEIFQSESGPDEVPEPPDEPVTRTGDLWVLGKHSLLCGDATSKDDVENLLDGETPFMMVTDPPYGVEYDPQWRELYDQFERHSTDKIKNDDRVDWSAAWSLFPGDVAYIWHASWFIREVSTSLEDCHFQLRSLIIWAKQHFTFSRGHYHWQHEPCWYAVRKGKTAHWSGDRTQSTIWDIQNHNPMGGKQDDENTKLSAQKPVECMLRPIRNHGAKGDLIYDPFVGSGTTIIACEQASRRCVAIEIDPIYCDVTVARWEKFTGKKAERIPHKAKPKKPAKKAKPKKKAKAKPKKK